MLEKLEAAAKAVDHFGGATKKLLVTLVLTVLSLVGPVRYAWEHLNPCALGLSSCSESAHAHRPPSEAQAAVPPGPPARGGCDLSGLVIDPAGAAVAGAVIELSRIGRLNQPWREGTSTTGQFCAPPLAVGVYRLVIRKSNFNDIVQEVHVTVGVKHFLTVPLEPQRLFPAPAIKPAPFKGANTER